MTYFPIFINLENKNVLIVGAGEVALRKIQKLMPFNPKITVVAKQVKRQEIYDLYKEKKYNFLKGILKKRIYKTKILLLLQLMI